MSRSPARTEAACHASVAAERDPSIPLGQGAKRTMKRRLLERDGMNCWLCGKHMPEDDRTIEHLVALSRGGKNDPANLVLTHGACNNDLGNMKADQKRAKRAATQLATPFDWAAWNAEMDAHKVATAAALEKWNAACIAEEQAHRDLVTDLRVIIGGLS